MSFLYKRLVKLAEIANEKEKDEKLLSKELKLEKLKYARTISTFQPKTRN